MKIIMTGGHLTPALAFLEFLQEKKKPDTIIFLGRKFTKKNQEQISQEKIETTKFGAKFISFNSVKLTQNTFLAKSLSIPILFLKTLTAMRILVQEKPDVFLSFGGYLAVPVAVACWILRIPILTHEQTRSAGVANTIIAKFAQIVALSYQESGSYFPKRKTRLTGNLIRKSVVTKNQTQPKWIKKQLSKPLLYITGGSQGSEIINRTVSQILKPLLKNWSIIHQCGKPIGKTNYKIELTRIKNRLSQANQENYHIVEWVGKENLAWIYSTAKGVISRSGANTTEEIALNKIPAILIPLPFSHNDEQLKNAQALSENKQAILLEQKNLTPDVLLEATKLLLKYQRKFTRNLQLFSSIQDSEKKVYDLLKTLVKKS